MSQPSIKPSSHLLPCPFCGGEATFGYVEHTDNEDDPNAGGEFIDCSQCHASTSAILDPGSIRKTFTVDFLEDHRQKLSDLKIVTFNDDGHHFINWSRFHMLHMGATRYLAERVQELESKLLALEHKP